MASWQGYTAAPKKTPTSIVFVRQVQNQSCEWFKPANGKCPPPPHYYGFGVIDRPARLQFSGRPSCFQGESPVVFRSAQMFSTVKGAS